MNSKQLLLVREVRLQRGFIARADDPDVVSDMCCPLCVLQRRTTGGDLTATVSAVSGHIWCNHGCQRYSSILLPTMHGELPLYPVSLHGVRHFEAQQRAKERLDAALHGEGDLFDLVTMDIEHPTEDRTIAVPVMRLDVHRLLEVAAR